LDASAILKPAVYILRLRGRVVFIGAAAKPVVRLYAHAAQRRGAPAPAWLPVRPIEFDDIELIPCRVEDLAARLGEVAEAFGWRASATYAKERSVA
jgi:hypothetical protein